LTLLKGKKIPEALVRAVYDKVLKVLNDKIVSDNCGGTHTVSIGAVRAFSECFRDLSVLQLDAHSDLRQDMKVFSLTTHARWPESVN